VCTDLGHDLEGDLNGNQVPGAHLPVVLPGVARAQEVLVLNVEKPLGAPGVESESGSNTNDLTAYNKGQ
jgi:hypothetical protein